MRSCSTAEAGFDVREDGRLRLEGKWNKSGKSSRFILQFAELTQVIDPLLQRLDVAIEHGASAAATHLVPGAVDLEPFLRAFLAAAELVAHLRIENLRAAASERAQTGIAQNRECVARWKA